MSTWRTRPLGIDGLFYRNYQLVIGIAISLFLGPTPDYEKGSLYGTAWQLAFPMGTNMMII